MQQGNSLLLLLAVGVACIIWRFRKEPGGADPASGRD
jgi:hypothetical protein